MSFDRRIEPRGHVRDPADAMLRADRSRVRFFIRLHVVLSLLALPALSALGGDPHLRHLAEGAVVVWIVAGLAMLAWTRERTRYRSAHGTAFGILSAVLFSATLPFFGPLSAMIVLIPFGILLFSQTHGLARAAAVYLTGASGHAALAVAEMSGLVPSRGLFHVPEHRLETGVILLVFQQLIFFGGFLMARALHRSGMDSLEALAAATRELALRQAELVEAHDALARAATGGVGGRFSGAVLGRWRLENLLGRGGTGEVYEAREVDGEAVAAVKVIARATLDDHELVERFEREARLLAQIESPHVVRLLELPHAAESVPHLVMERLEGLTLAEVLRAKGALSVEEVLEMARQVALGLSAAHAAGVVHRDLKPDNVFCVAGDGAPLWKVLDFGVSKVVDQDATRRGFVLGTPTYAAPEQARGERVDSRCDVHALAAVCYRSLTGRPPFTGSDPAATLFAVCERLPPAPSRLTHGVPAAIDLAFLYGLAKRPRDRAPTAPAFADALAEAASGQLSPGLEAHARRLAERHPWDTAA